MKLVNALNSVHSNVWGVFLITAGTVLACCHQAAIGTTVLTGGFALVNATERRNRNGDGNETAAAAK